MKMRKIVAVVLTVLMLCCIIPFSAMADSGSATIDFGDKANRVSYSTEKQVWEQNGITVTNDKAASTTNVGDYGGDGFPVRFYKSSAVTVEYPGMTKIVFNCDNYKASYATDLQASITEGSVSVDGTVVTVVLDAPINSFVIAELAAQVRVDSITVYAGEGGDTPAIPDEPEVPSEDPEADTELSIADAIALGASKEHNTYTEGKYFVTGVITEVYNTQYGNMYITDGNDTLLIYGTYSADGELRYDAMDVQPVAGDTVTIYGAIGQYNGNPQIKNGWITEHTTGDAPVVPDEPDTPDEPENSEIGVVAAPVAGTAYKFGMVQGNVSSTDVYYLIGGMNGYYMATGTDAAAAIDVYLEETSGGYYCYAMVNGVKTYINMVVSGTHVNGAYEAAASTIYTFDADAKTIIANVNDADYWFGTRNDMSYTTVGPCKVEYAGFYCQFYAVGGETPDVPDEPDTPDEPEIPASEQLTIAEAIALGLAQEHNVFTTEKYIVSGVISEVYNDMYGNMRLVDEAGNVLTIYGTYSADGSTRYDAMEVKPVAGDTITVYGVIGQYNGTPQVKNGWIIEHVAAGGETPDEPDQPNEPNTPDQPDEPEQPDEPAKPVAPAVDTAYKFGMTQGNLDGKVFYLAGGMNGYYMATTEDINAAIDVYLEETQGGYYFYTIENGSRLYINMVVSGTHVNGAYEATASTVYTYDAVAKTLVADVEGATYWFGTRNDKQYTTMGPCNTEYEGFYGLFYTAGGEPVQPEQPGETPSTGDNSVVYVTVAMVLMVLAAAVAIATSKKRA